MRLIIWLLLASLVSETDGVWLRTDVVQGAIGALEEEDTTHHILSGLKKGDYIQGHAV
jgi:hypothetical protein